MESPRAHAQTSFSKPARFLVVIESSGSMLARLFSAKHEMVTTIDAAVEEVGSMISGLIPETGALGAEWDQALAGHSAEERTAAKIYTLAI